MVTARPLNSASLAPTLDTLAEDPGRVADLTLADVAAMLVRCAGTMAVLSVRLAEAAKPAPTLHPPLDLETAAPLLGMVPDTLRRRTHHRSHKHRRAPVLASGASVQR
jgi:hypothetical protein